MIERIAILAVALALAAPAAAQSWYTVEEDDIFTGSTTARMFGVVDGWMNIYVDCNSDRRLDLGLVFEDEWQRDRAGRRVDILVQIDDGEADRFQARPYQYNARHSAIGTVDDGIADIVRRIRDARERVLLGLHWLDTGDKLTYATDAGGARQAAERFMAACGIDADG